MNLPRTGVMLTAGLLAGCAAGADDGWKVPTAQVCAAFLQAQARGDHQAARDISEVLSIRYVREADCPRIVREDRERRVASGDAILGALAIAGVVAAARGNPGFLAVPGAVDNQWAWDQFYNDHQALVWACRGAQTGQFAPAAACLGVPKIDGRWPGMRFYP